jgi:hypothetical protein
LGILVTLIAVIYQRNTVPTYDKNVQTIIDGREYQFTLVRSHGGKTDCPLELQISDEQVTVEIHYRKYPTNNKWNIIAIERHNDVLSGSLPNLPPAGKYEYKIILKKGARSFPLNNGESVIICFKGDVPANILVPHIILMFLAMLMSNLAGIMALFKNPKFRYFTRFTFWTLLVGGLIFGLWVQWYAFGEAWAGVPFAWDLTDNKTLVVFLFWLLAFVMNRKKEKPTYTIVAAAIMLVIFSIPHSMYGSQLDPETGEIIQGYIKLQNYPDKIGNILFSMLPAGSISGAPFLINFVLFQNFFLLLQPPEF